MDDIIRRHIVMADGERLSRTLTYLAEDPLPCRTLNTTLPGHEKPTLHEADDYITGLLESWGYTVEREPVEVQAYRRDETKNAHHQYSAPDPSDPHYTAYNLIAGKIGTKNPDELVVAIAHKDSQSWLGCSAGAYDNGVGTVATLEIARILKDYPSRRSMRFIFCNEEHTPWTSETAARKIAQSGLSIVAALNIDSLGGKSAEEIAEGKKTNVTRYVTPEGEALADLMAELNDRYQIGLEQKKYRSERPNDDDGSFVKAGFPSAVANVGSMPYADPNYHLTSDVPKNVDLTNVLMATKLCLAFIMHVDAVDDCR